jgi:Protein of unknown function (DUF1173)
VTELPSPPTHPVRAASDVRIQHTSGNSSVRTGMMAIDIEFPNLGTYTREWLEEHPDQAQLLLRRSKGQYPRCLCRSPGSPLYIAQRAKFYLARLPGSGPDHAPACPSYEPEASLCGWGIYTKKALEDRGDGRIQLRLSAPLAIRATLGAQSGSPPAHVGAERTQRDAIGLRGLLHLLWERSEFNRWRPAMLGRRRYKQVYKYLGEAAESVTLRRETLTHFLFMPEPFDQNQRLQIEARRQRALAERSESASGTPMRVLVAGQVHSILPLEEAVYGISLAHVPREFMIRATSPLLFRLRQETEFAWLDWPTLYSEFRLIVLFTMQRSRHGNWTIDELAGMVTTLEYIPVLSIEEAVLAQQLVRQSRTFYKPLPYDAGAARLPNFLLIDCGNAPVPLEIIGHDEPDAATRQMRLAEYAEARKTHWRWDSKTDSLPPSLPEAAA